MHGFCKLAEVHMEQVIHEDQQETPLRNTHTVTRLTAKLTKGKFY